MAKYIIDIDAFKECLDLVKTMKIDGHDAAYIQNIKVFIDCFPKDPVDFDISNLMIKGDTQ